VSGIFTQFFLKNAKATRVSDARVGQWQF